MLSYPLGEEFERYEQPTVDLEGARVLIFGINYWPEPTGIAPYTTEIAEYMAARGARVKVIAGLPHYPDWRVAPPYDKGFRFRQVHNGVEIIRLRHSVPGKMTVARRAAYEASYFAHAVLQTFSEHPDLIVAATPALGGARAAAVVAQRTKAPLLIHVQDLMAKAADQSGMSGSQRLSSMTGRFEGRALRAADQVLVISDTFREAVASYGVDDERISVLENWTRITASSLSRDEARMRLGWPATRFLAVHTGNMGFKQDLGNVIEAARHLGDKRIEIVLVGHGSQRHELEKQAAGLGTVRIVDLVDDETYPHVLAAADVLLVNERPSVEQMSMPSKVTSYLAAGRPIVAAVADGGATHRFVNATVGAALTVDPGRPRVLADTLEGLVGRERLLADMGRRAKVFSQTHLEAEVALAKFGALAASLLGAGRDPSRGRGKIRPLRALELQQT